MKITASTALYGIIGWPVGHSLSPLFQNHFLQQRQADAAYLPFPVEPELLADAIDGLWALGVQGFNVTVPHKESVFQRVEADDGARRIGAVNTVRRGETGWLATNTDWLGFKAVIEASRIDVAGRDVLLFGAGGTARAVLHALALLRPARVTICNRNPERLRTLLADAAHAYPDLNCEALAWQQEQVTAACQEASLLINTTAIGLKPDHTFPFELSGAGAAIDAVYRPNGRTAFTTAAHSRRFRCDGLPMLIAQGAASFAWWHHCPMPDCQQALRLVERQLNRDPVNLPGWID